MLRGQSKNTKRGDFFAVGSDRLHLLLSFIGGEVFVLPFGDLNGFDLDVIKSPFNSFGCQSKYGEIKMSYVCMYICMFDIYVDNGKV